MKVFKTFGCLMLAGAFFTGALYAAPQRVAIKSGEERERGARAKIMAGKVNLAGVDDPEARAALETVLQAMGLDHKASRLEGRKP